MSRRYSLPKLLFLALTVFACLEVAHGQKFLDEQIVGGGIGSEYWNLNENQMYVHDNIVYVVWTVERPAQDGGRLSRLRRSLDGGHTWQPMYPLGNGTATMHFGGNTVYVLLQREPTSGGGRIAELRRSSNKGANFDAAREVARHMEDPTRSFTAFANGNALFLQLGRQHCPCLSPIR